MPHSAMLGCVSTEYAVSSRGHSPCQVDLHKDISLVSTLSVLDNENQSHKTKDAGDPSYSKDGSNLEFRPDSHLKLLCQRAWQEQDDYITQKTDDIVSEDENSLVEALAVSVGMPELVHRSADECLESHHHDVVDGHDTEEAVYPLDVGLVRRKDSGEEEENGGLDGKDCRAIIHHGGVDGLR